jgi:glutamate synthase domain-containing protein 3
MFLGLMAGEIRELLAQLGVRSLDEVIGQRRYLKPAKRFADLIDQRGLDLSSMVRPIPYVAEGFRPRTVERSVLNQRIIDDVLPAIENGDPIQRTYRITNVDRAVLAGLSGVLAGRARERRLAELDGETPNFGNYDPPPGSAKLNFEGSAGQGFAAFQVGGLDVRLEGEANDSVCKSMSGGKVVIVPPPSVPFLPEDNVIIGNCALYGATGGELYVSGRAGDRFGVRNSGARAVVEGTGLHCCEYMTGGIVVVLGPVSLNVGAGMTGGVLYLGRNQQHRLNREYVRPVELGADDIEVLAGLLQRHADETDSTTARALLVDHDRMRETMCRVEPNR